MIGVRGNILGILPDETMANFHSECTTIPRNTDDHKGNCSTQQHPQTLLRKDRYRWQNIFNSQQLSLTRFSLQRKLKSLEAVVLRAIPACSTRRLFPLL
jgi:hypothetical protein